MATVNRVLGSLGLAIVSSCVSACVDPDTDRSAQELELDTSTASVEQPCRAHRSQLRVMTFNSALAPAFEPLALERAPAVISALASAAHEVDMMCVQELWLEEHFTALRSNTSELAHVLRMPPRPGTGGCSEAELGPLAGCLGANCADASGERLVGCAKLACPVQVAALSGGCLGCILDHLDDFSVCQEKADEPSDPAVFGGAFELAFMTRWPIVHADTRELSSYFVRASVLHARVDVPRRGLVDAYCTHLGSDLGIVPYAGKYGSFEGEHLQQVREVVEFVKATNRGKRPIVLMGDFNMGPQVGDNSASWADHYDRLVQDLDLDNAYVAGSAPLCTLCAGTTFRGPTSTNEIIDHVFSWRLGTRNAAQERLFTAPMALGDELPTFNLSDHFAVRVVFP